MVLEYALRISFEDLDIEFSGAPFPSPSSTDDEKQLLNDSNLNNKLRQFMNDENDIDYGPEIRKLENLLPELVEKEKDSSNKILEKLIDLNQELNNFEIDMVEVPEFINFEYNTLLVVLNRKKNEKRDILLEQTVNLNKLDEVKSNVSTIFDFNDKLRKIVTFLNLIRDITPIINTYSKPYYDVKTKIGEILEKLKNPSIIDFGPPAESPAESPGESSTDSNLNTLDDKSIKKQILKENQEILQSLDSISSEIKNSSDFILKK